MRTGVAIIALVGLLSACSVTGAVVSVASTAVGVAADVGAVAVKGTYKAGKAVASTMESKPEKPVETVRVVGQPVPAEGSRVNAQAEAATAVISAETAEPSSQSRVDRLAGY